MELLTLFETVATTFKIWKLHCMELTSKYIYTTWLHVNKMEKFLGITPSKKPKKDEDRLKQQQQYEANKRTRQFQNSWLKNHSWLEYFVTNGTGKMYCKSCRRYDMTGSFSMGNSNFKVESLKAHEKSKSHLKYSSIFLAKITATSQSVAAKSLMTINRQVVDRISNLFRIAHSLSKHGRPYTDFPWMCQLSEAMGVDLGQTYRNDKRAQEMIHQIADTQREICREESADAKFMAVISDGATDSSHKEAEILFARFAHQGKVNTHFIGIKNVGKPDANEIENAISSTLDEGFGAATWKSKLVATGTDGASVMMGKNNGVVKKLSDRVGRKLFGVHCSAHKLELAYKDACTKIQFYGKVANLLQNLYYFYRNSPLNRHNLKESFSVFARSPRMPSRVCGTRWLPHTLRAIANIIHGLGPLITHLNQIRSCGQDRSEKGAKAKNFLSLLTQKDVIHFLHFLWDVVATLSKVSLKFQDRSTTVADVYREIEAAKAILESYKVRDGPKLASVQEADMFDELTGTLSSFPACRSKLVELLLTSLSKRFDVEADVLQATAIINIGMWPTKEQLESTPEFGDAAIKKLISKDVFGHHLDSAEVDTDTIPDEWTRFKSLVYTSYDQIPSLDWERLNSAFKTDCPGLLDLVDLVLTIPASSVEAERGFSYMKIVKTDWRSRLSDSSLSNLLLVQMESPSIHEFNPERAVTGWMSGGRRRPTFLHTEELDPKEIMQAVVDVDEEETAAPQESVEPDSPAEEDNLRNPPVLDHDEGFMDEYNYSDIEDDYDSLTVHESRAYSLLKTHLISHSD